MLQAVTFLFDVGHSHEMLSQPSPQSVPSYSKAKRAQASSGGSGIEDSAPDPPLDCAPVPFSSPPGEDAPVPSPSPSPFPPTAVPPEPSPSPPPIPSRPHAGDKSRGNPSSIKETFRKAIELRIPSSGPCTPWSKCSVVTGRWRSDSGCARFFLAGGSFPSASQMPSEFSRGASDANGSSVGPEDGWYPPSKTKENRE